MLEKSRYDNKQDEDEKLDDSNNAVGAGVRAIEPN